MALARTYGLGLVRGMAEIFKIEVEIRQGLPKITFLGMVDTNLREVRDRVRAAIINSGESWPDGEITVKLSPRRLPDDASTLDLAMAIAILAARGDGPDKKLDSTLFLSELGLDGQLRSTPRMPDTPTAILRNGLSKLSKGERYVVVVADRYEAPFTRLDESDSGLAFSLAGEHLRDVVSWLRGNFSPVLTSL